MKNGPLADAEGLRTLLVSCGLSVMPLTPAAATVGPAGAGA